jgi:hypothetical protein
MPISYRPVSRSEPNHRQEMALERIEFAVAQLASALLSNCRSRGASDAAMIDVRRALAPVLADILSEE